jgi:hypothetical protein
LTFRWSLWGEHQAYYSPGWKSSEKYVVGVGCLLYNISSLPQPLVYLLSCGLLFLLRSHRQHWTGEKKVTDLKKELEKSHEDEKTLQAKIKDLSPLQDLPDKVDSLMKQVTPLL